MKVKKLYEQGYLFWRGRKNAYAKHGYSKESVCFCENQYKRYLKKYMSLAGFTDKQIESLYIS